MNLNGRRRTFKAGHNRRRHNWQFGLAIGVVRTVHADILPTDRPVFSIDLNFATHNLWATWS